jgi:hypothetical protein
VEILNELLLVHEYHGFILNLISQVGVDYELEICNLTEDRSWIRTTKSNHGLAVQCVQGLLQSDMYPTHVEVYVTGVLQ